MTCTPSARSLRSRLRRASGESRPSCPLGVPASPEGSPFHSVLSLVAFPKKKKEKVPFSSMLSLEAFPEIGDGSSRVFVCVCDCESR